MFEIVIARYGRSGAYCGGWLHWLDRYYKHSNATWRFTGLVQNMLPQQRDWRQEADFFARRRPVFCAVYASFERRIDFMRPGFWFYV